MKKMVYTISLALVILFVFQIVDAGEPLKLSGKITSIEMENKSNSVSFSLKAKMTFKNLNDESILLPKVRYPNSSPYSPPNGIFLTVCSQISGVLATEKNEKRLYSACALPSIEATSDWQIIRNELDSKTPPLNQYLCQKDV